MMVTDHDPAFQTIVTIMVRILQQKWNECFDFENLCCFFHQNIVVLERKFEQVFALQSCMSTSYHIATILASLTRRYSARSAPFRMSSKARNSSSCLKMRRICLMHPLAVSKSDSNDCLEKSGCGASAKYSLNGKSAIRGAMRLVVSVEMVLLALVSSVILVRYSSHLGCTVLR